MMAFVTSSSQHRALPERLVLEVEDGGFYPTVVIDSLADTVAGRPVIAHLVHNEATFAGVEAHRHLTVLVLLDGTMVICHADEADRGRALVTTEVIRLSSIQSVVLTRSVSDPASPRSDLAEAWLTVIWGAARRIDLGPGMCDDPTCDADHGYQGLSSAEDYVVRMSREADGVEQTGRLVEFATVLQGAIA